jgi:hypothetical protein
MVKKADGKSGLAWHAVSIVPRQQACAAALALRGKRFLSRTEAPPLPLPDCTLPADCSCVYKHHADRRGGPRRAIERTGVDRKPPKAEVRARRGRRESDFAE